MFNDKKSSVSELLVSDSSQGSTSYAEKDDVFSLYVSSEPGTRLSFAGSSVNVGRCSTIATTTCSKLV